MTRRRFRSLRAFATSLLLTAATLPLAAQDLTIRNAAVLNADGDGFLPAHTITIRAGRIDSITPTADAELPDAIDGTGLFVIPGLIDLHTHLLLHPYNETSWNDQVLVESLELRTIRATVAARATLYAGFTTIRELGTEGAGFADVALRDAIRAGIIPGPTIFATTRALVATGCYGPAGFDPRWTMPKGAQVADGVDGVTIAVREQIAAGADWIKVYADYRRREGDPATPTYSLAELQAIVAEATSAGLLVAAHAVTSEAIRRCVLAGVRTIEHGYQASPEALALMRDHDVVLCPTLAANEAMVRYSGANPIVAERLNIARITFQRARVAGVTIACGSDAGVFAHGDNAREIELMVDYGMSTADALRAATTIAARVLGREDDLGRIAPAHRADLVVLRADPLTDITALRDPAIVIQGGVVVTKR